MTIEELNKIKENVRRKAEKAAYCRGLEAGRKEQEAKDNLLIENIKEEHHYDKVFLKEKLINKACKTFCDFCPHQCEGFPHDDCEVLIEYKKKMEE